MNFNLIDKKLISISLSILIAELFTLPICTIKTIYQNNKLTTIQTIKKIYLEKKIYGFYQGIIPAIIFQIISYSSKYILYQKIKNLTIKNDILLNNFINGILSGIIVNLLTHPIDVWRNFVQLNKNYMLHLRTVKYSLKNGFYIGFMNSIYKNLILNMLLFPLNDYFKYKFNSLYISSILTTIVISIIVQPFDYYKTIKISNNGGNNYFRGFHLTILRSIPHFLIINVMTDFLIKIFN